MTEAEFLAFERDREAVNALVRERVAETRPLQCNTTAGCGKTTVNPDERRAVLYDDFAIILCSACDEAEDIASGVPF